MPITKISTLPSSANVEHKFYGPEEKIKVKGQKEERKKYVYAFNETPSLTDTVVYRQNVDTLIEVMKSKSIPKSLRGRIQEITQIKTELADDPSYERKTNHELVEEAVKRYVDNPKNLQFKNEKSTIHDIVLVPNREEIDVWLDPQQLAQKYNPAIQEHFRRRIDLFLLQLISCYGTQLHFEVGKTQHQAESSKSLYVESEGERQKVCKLGPRQPTHNAAHSSTFPCLVAYDSKKWQDYQAGKCDKPTGIYFLQNSDIYKGTNSTCNLPRFVNDADIAVDGATHQSSFSNQALAIINQISEGSMTVERAMEKFLVALEVEIRGKKRVAKDPGVKASLQIYYDEIKALAQEFDDNREEWIFSKVDLLINQEDTTNSLRAAMLKIRSEGITRNMRGQAELMNKVNTLAQQILKEMQRKKIKTPAYYTEAFKLLLIEKMGTVHDRQRIIKLFSLIDPERVGTRKVGIQKSKEAICAVAELKGVDRIKELARTLSADMRTLRTEEVGHRGDAMRVLRAGKRWTQVKLGKKLRKYYPDQPSSQSTICRTERGYRVMSDRLAAQLSETFDVPKELLLPQVFFV